MAVKQASYFKIGLFIITGLFIGIGTLIYLSTHQYLHGANTYLTFFEESVQGLQKDSIVKYRGVEVGRVRSIRVAPDNNLIEVLMDIQCKGSPSDEMIAQLKMVGITGIAYIELDRKPSDQPSYFLPLSFPVEHPVIASRPSEINQLFNLVEDIARQFRRIDFKSIFNESQKLLNAGQELLKNESLKKIITNLESMTTILNNATSQVNHFIKKNKLKVLIRQVETTTSEAKALIKIFKTQIFNLKLPEISQQTSQLIEEVHDDVTNLSGELNLTTQTLHQAFETLNRLFIRLEHTPSDILFSSPPPYHLPQISESPQEINNDF